MKTADSIEQQPERKAARDNGENSADQGDSSPTSTHPVRKKSGRGDASRIAKWKWQKGFAPNPTGKNGRHDIAAELARACFENNLPALYASFSKALLKGNAYAFKELSDRAYGKMKEKIEVEAGPLRDMSDEGLRARVAELQAKLGLVPALPPAEDDSKPN